MTSTGISVVGAAIRNHPVRKAARSHENLLGLHVLGRHTNTMIMMAMMANTDRITTIANTAPTSAAVGG